ncbi:murein hydrolase activator EnvC [Caulobacter sp. UNC279MFTsu5.1]|uniref:murein hydrolase activator EnvC family protein n=1 Tax=Caulobacter sp. UNC279MFTsu5.1 TaxID=1502775 RepID=UPI0008F393E6|nr:peptidoglycan DD-metalloendopeptidase family protein [Caulobacter sp. UNC279MFTsu5.1]SFJ43355.1 Septal ring factor EnvC, activator of murein hydrolases AmiA and AmiB [Caulobacter sp. UNC279MFTsu5.1]
MSRRVALIAVSLLSLALGGATVVAAAQKAATSQRAKDEQAAADTRREIADLRGELDALGRQRVDAGDDVTAKRARLEALHQRESALVAELGRDRGQLARLLSALQLFRRDPPPALLVSPNDARDAVRAAILIRAMTPELQARADGYARQARAVSALRREAAAASEQLFTAESLVADRKGDLERMIVEKTQLERAYAQEALTGDDQGTLGALTDGLAPRPATGPLVLASPAPGPLERRFGQAMPAGGRATGLTIRTQKGHVVASPAAGVVEYAGPLNGWGSVLILRAQGAYHLVLAGMDQVSVGPGQSVAPGATVGRMADHGSSEPELYFEVREDGAPVDPERWLKQGSR